MVGAGCSKDSKPDKGKTDEKKDEPRVDVDKAPVMSAKKLPNLPLQADVADSWKIEEDKVAPEGGLVQA